MPNTYKSDIEIAQGAKPEPIGQIAAKLGIGEDYLERYGKYKAKVDYGAIMARDKSSRDGKLILVTAISPTPAGEGKTTTSVGLADGLSRLGHKAVLAIREPSLGPVFGVKGGAAGGGYAQVVPMEDINLHFTGDLHAITCANNLLAALVDNHIAQGNPLKIDGRKIVFRRCLDMNDRQLRNIVDGLGGKVNGAPREDGFDITAASEIMATLCMASDIKDLKRRIGRIIVGYDTDDNPVTASKLKAEGAMTALLKEAIKPNLVQTLEHTPAFVHLGPFANIAHGCNSVVATKLSLKLGDYVVTEAGFGADLGAEKFLDIKCRSAGLNPSAVVVVATIRALKFHGGVAKEDLGKPNLDAVIKGMPNLIRHTNNITQEFGLPCIVAINKFPTDTDAEVALIAAECRKLGVNVALSDVWAKGGEGAAALASAVVELISSQKTAPKLKHPYSLELGLSDKIRAVATRIYKADGVVVSDIAKAQIAKLESMGLGKLPVCIAKTQYSFSDNPSLLGAPTGYNISVKNVKVSAGAGFVVALTGDIMTMPGLPKVPAAEGIDIDDSGRITGLF